MSYTTNLKNTTSARRKQLKQQMDSFSTFTWRGDSAFDKFGAFIIADKPGDLKFYNGGSFSNEYSKSQFNPASGNLLSVTFNKQKISFKVGVYWFSASEWQDFLEWINPYEVNYLSFGYATKYGYLVKLAKIADSPRYILGNGDDGQPRYYTELQLEWDLQGENCVRSNLPYEWNYDEGEFSLSDIQEANTFSKLPTPLVLKIPLEFPDNEDITSVDIRSIEAKCGDDQLFKIEFNSIPTKGTNDVPTHIYEFKDTINFFEGKMADTQVYSIDFHIGTVFYDQIEINHGEQEIYYRKIDGNVIQVYPNDDNGNSWSNYSQITTAMVPLPIGLRKLLKDYNENDSYSEILNTDSFYKQNYYSDILTLQYDSETGNLLYQVGNSKWRLLHLNLINSNGEYIVKSFIANKYKLKGDLSGTKVLITYTGCSAAATPILQVYERTNVI